MDEQIPTAPSSEPSDAAASARPHWKWIVAGGLIFLALLYPIVRSIRNSMLAATTPAAPAPGSAPDLLAASFRLYQEKKYDEAIALTKAILARDPSIAEAYNNMGVSYAGLGQWDEAARCLQEAVRLKPDYQLAKNNLVWIGQEKLKQAQPPRAGTAEYFLNRSLEEYQAGRFQESLNAALQALKLRPEYAEAYNNVAVARISLKQYDEAIAAAQTALRLNPNFTLARNNLAWAVAEKKKADGERAGSPR